MAWARAGPTPFSSLARVAASAVLMSTGPANTAPGMRVQRRDEKNRMMSAFPGFEYGDIRRAGKARRTGRGAPRPCLLRSCRNAHSRLPRARRFLALLGPLEDGRAHAVPRAALRAVPVPADASQPAVIALIPSARVADARQHRSERARLGARGIAAGQLGQLLDAERRQRRREQPAQLPLAHAPRTLQPLGERLDDAVVAE